MLIIFELVAELDCNKIDEERELKELKTIDVLKLIEELKIAKVVLDEPVVVLLLETVPMLLVLNLEELERLAEDDEASLELDEMLADDDFELLEAMLLEDIRVVVDTTLDIFELEGATDVVEDSFELDLLLEVTG